MICEMNVGYQFSGVERFGYIVGCIGYKGVVDVFFVVYGGDYDYWSVFVLFYLVYLLIKFGVVYVWYLNVEYEFIKWLRCCSDFV